MFKSCLQNVQISVAKIQIFSIRQGDETKNPPTVASRGIFFPLPGGEGGGLFYNNLLHRTFAGFDEVDAGRKGYLVGDCSRRRRDGVHTVSTGGNHLTQRVIDGNV